MECGTPAPILTNKSHHKTLRTTTASRVATLGTLISTANPDGHSPPPIFEHNARFRDTASQKRSFSPHRPQRDIPNNFNLFSRLSPISPWRSACHLLHRHEHRT